MSLSDDERIYHHTEAGRLLKEAASLGQESDRLQPGDPRRADVDADQSHAEQQAIGHALLALVELPPRFTPESTARRRKA